MSIVLIILLLKTSIAGFHRLCPAVSFAHLHPGRADARAGRRSLVHPGKERSDSRPACRRWVSMVSGCLCTDHGGGAVHHLRRSLCGGRIDTPADPVSSEIGPVSRGRGGEERPQGPSRDHRVRVNGRNLDRAATAAGIPHMIIEMNAESVRKERTKGKPIFYGDATQETVLHYAGVTDARVVVVAIPDAAATRRITETVRRLNSKVQLIARTRFVQEVKPFTNSGPTRWSRRNSKPR